MPFDAIARDYDRMIDWTARLAREIPLLHAIFQKNGVRRIIDFGCGTGRHAVELLKLGYVATGVDSSAEMRRMAAENGASAGLVVVETLKDLRGPFDAIMTIGNTLPSVQTRHQLTATFRRMHGLVRPSGLLLIQIRNYDGLSPDDVVTTGLRETPDAIYFRAYHLENTPHHTRWVHLHAFKLGRGERRMEASGSLSRLRAWGRMELQDCLPLAGWDRVTFHSDYALSELTVAAPDIVVLAVKS